jgi:hypothetical protein
MGDLALAVAIAEGISDEVASFVAVAQGSAGYAYVTVSRANDNSGTSNIASDISPIGGYSIPTSLSVSKTGGTHTWSANATNGETSFTLSIGAGTARYAGFTITAKNTQIGTNRALTSVTAGGTGDGGFFRVPTALAASSFLNSGNVDGAAATTIDSEIGGYIRAYADSAAGVTPTGTTKTKLAWL